MQTLIIDLKSNPEVAAAVAGVEPGSSVTIRGSIQALDDQSLTVTVEEVEASEGGKAEYGDGDESAMIPDAE